MIKSLFSRMSVGWFGPMFPEEISDKGFRDVEEEEEDYL